MTSLDAPVRVGDLVQHQSGSVVSQTLAKSKAGTVTAFAFDAGEGLSEHTAPFDAFVQIIDGTARITIGGDEHVMSAGEIVRLPANVPHAVHAEEAFKMMLTMIREAS